MTPYLFERRICGWQDWADVFQDASAFLPLARAIYAREGLPPPGALSHLTPGTNAVFRAGETVIKIYAPEASGFSSARDFAVERAMLEHAASVEIPVSTLLASGTIEDSSIFHYLILAYVDGREAGSVLPLYRAARRERFAMELWALLAKLHQPVRKPLPPLDIRARAMNNLRLDKLPAGLARSFIERAEAAELSGAVPVHGDITGENVLIRPDGSLVLIDFADACMAPPLYELPPILFALMRGDRALVRPFIGARPFLPFVESAVTALSLHDFGPDLLLEDAERHGIQLQRIEDLTAYQVILRERWR